MSLPPAHKCLHAAFASMLLHKTYRDRWYSIHSLNLIGNAFAPDGLALNRFTVQNAFAITGRGFYAEYLFSDQLKEALKSPKDYIFVVRRIQRADKTAGYFTAVGYFDKKSDKLSEEKARAVDTSNSLGRISIRSDDEAFNLPSRIKTDLLAYAKKKDKRYFIALSDRPPTPLPVLLFMAKNICAVDKYKDKKNYLNIVATKLIELMTSKADPKQDSPTHYTTLRWIVAFGDAFYDANFEWVKRHDPVFGPGSYGHNSRLVPEHLFVMHKQLQALKKRWLEVCAGVCWFCEIRRWCQNDGQG
jgi:hypothetical protein